MKCTWINVFLECVSEQPNLSTQLHDNGKTPMQVTVHVVTKLRPPPVAWNTVRTFGGWVVMELKTPTSLAPPPSSPTSISTGSSCTWRGVYSSPSEHCLDATTSGCGRAGSYCTSSVRLVEPKYCMYMYMQPKIFAGQKFRTIHLLFFFCITEIFLQNKYSLMR